MATENAGSCVWWEAATEGKSDSDIVTALGTTVTTCRKRLSRRYDADLFFTRLALGPDLSGLGARDSNRGGGERSRFNLVQAAISTAASLIAHHKPMPLALTQEGDFKAMRRARKLTQALGGMFNSLGVHRITPKTFMDANYKTFGCLHGYLDEKGRPALQRVDPLELSFDPTEAYDGEPRSMYRCRPYSREVLISRHPELKDELKAAPGPDHDTRRFFGLDPDVGESMLMLTEAWHLPSGEGEGDGRKVTYAGEALLDNEDWPFDRFPFVFYRFEERPTGFFGKGIAEHAVDSQIRINELIRKNSKLQDLGSNTWVFVDGSSDVKTTQLANAPMQVVRTTGREPKIVNHAATAPDLQVEIDRIQAQLLFALGLSESAAAGERAPGVYSGIGLRATDDIQVRRLTPHVKRWEDYHLDIAKMIMWLCDCATKENRNFSVDTEDRRGGSKWTKRILWRDVKMPKGQEAKIQIFPISSLPSSPQGKYAQVTDWIEAGYVSQSYALQLLDFPDTDAATRRMLADLEYAEWQVERCLDEEEVEISKFQDYDTAAEVFRTSYLQLEMQGAPSQVLELLDRLMEDLAEATGALIPPPPPPPVPGMPGDPAMGAMPIDPAIAQSQATGVAPGAVAQPGAGF